MSMPELDMNAALEAIKDNYYLAVGRPSAKNPAHVATEEEQAAIDYLNAQADQYGL
jgi:hypothetical protein